ncbi:Receptor kinase 3 [Tripterygium wilfordii]|uniref:Receptor-like serine/threonine-protein kinase n=1 Tax=Tripterygium wilfordii TaxID=458696 RepID=A0A7J7C3U2_TRIWF|nr:receptor-like serine/threonine-protein kinase SD1-8 isoform X1 [Tripterygium wilfordii]KAF5728768.1 Receptor kinase 3 [Tripterygium wilfordii]
MIAEIKLFITFFTLIPYIVISTDTLTATQSLTNNQTLVSASGVFVFGFFTPGNSRKLYLGIWYKTIQVKTVVWVANRENPLTNPSAILKINHQGLLLVDEAENLVWSSNKTKIKADNPVLQLLDTANLVIREANNNDADGYLWQSFDYPTDTLLPSMKLGWDLNTGLNRYLSSWRSSDDPASGDFSYKINYHGFPDAFFYNREVRIFRSGPWNGLRFTSGPEKNPLPYIHFTFVTNQDEVYYTYEITKKSLFSRLVSTPYGEIQRLTWIESKKEWSKFWYAPNDQCDNYNECGPYGICDSNSSPVCKCTRGFEPKNPTVWNLRDASGGCVRKTQLECVKDKFLRMKNMKLPESITSFVDANMNLKQCEGLCSKNCSCTAYANSNITNGGTGCVIWTSELLDMRQRKDGQDLYVRLASSDLDDGGNIHLLVIGVGVVVGSGILVVVLIGYFAWKRKALPSICKGETDKKGERSRDVQLSEVVILSENNVDYLELPSFDFGTIATATNNFADENKLGQGGFGSVYKGRLIEGQDIAVKRLSKISGQGTEEFMNEVRLIARLQHRNLVRLLGCCIEMDENILIYEYMEHRSLDAIIFSQSRSALLNWPRRFNIICGIARGLLYLHQDSRFRIIHRDLKTSNVLLDGDMNPKISDFGLARIFGGDQMEAKTRRVIGTYGYMSPEYAMNGLFSVKSDVFSFGVLVLEIVSGKKNTGFYHSNGELNLLGHAWRLWREGTGPELIDQSVGESYSLNEVLRCIQVALLCVQERTEDRPTMSSVVLMLSSETATMPQPKKPGFCLGTDYIESSSFSIKQHESCTVNQVTVTAFDPR